MQVALEARVAQEQLATQVLKVPQERQVSHHVERPSTWLGGKHCQIAYATMKISACCSHMRDGLL